MSGSCFKQKEFNINIAEGEDVGSKVVNFKPEYYPSRVRFENLVEGCTVFLDGKNITDSLVIALTEWVEMKNIMRLNRRIENNPFSEKSFISASKIRERNRKR